MGMYIHAHIHTYRTFNFHVSRRTTVQRTKKKKRKIQPSSRVIICIPSSWRPRACRAPWPSEPARVLHNFTNRAYNRRCKTRLRFDRLRGH